MNIFSKSLLLVVASAAIASCVDSQADNSGYASHGGGKYQQYSATNVTSGYNSHYNQPSNKQGGGYEGHSNPQNRWYRTGRNNTPPVGGYSGGRGVNTNGGNTYASYGYNTSGGYHSNSGNKTQSSSGSGSGGYSSH